MKISNHQPTHREVYPESYGIFHSDARNEKKRNHEFGWFCGAPTNASSQTSSNFKRDENL